jgi:tetratricopeptide (TPR) repeat protein
MSSDQNDREERLSVVLLACLEAIDEGRKPDCQELLARYPEFAGELARFLDDQRQVEQYTSPLRDVVQATPPPRGRAAAVAGLAARAELGDFRIVREVGRGGMGVVYEAQQLSLTRRVALKVLPVAAALDERRLQRFKNEAQAAAGLHHQNIVPVYFVGCAGDVHYYAMQFIDGHSLAAHLRELRREAGLLKSPEPAPSTETLPWASLSTDRSGRGRDYYRRVAQLMVQAALALEHAHERGVIHRDVKPSNLLLDGRGNLWVTDFGLAHLQHAEASLTQTGDLVGTLRYMSPEQALGQHVRMDHRTDVYSLGATLYELLTLRPAFTASDQQELLRQVALEEPTRPRRLARDIPVDLETVVLKAMEKTPHNRYANAGELAEDLRCCLEDRPIRARRPGVVRRLVKWARRHRPMVAAVAVVLVLAALLGGSTALWWTQQRAVAASKAREALAEATRLQDEHRWPEALSAIDRAKGALAGVGASRDLQQQVERLDKDLELIRRLEEARLRYTALKDGHYDWEGANAAYADAFAWYGLDVEDLDPHEAGQGMESRALRVQVAAALDDWAFLRRRQGVKGWKQLVAVSRALDPDPLRNGLRDVLEGKGGRSLKELAASAPSQTLPVATAGLLGRLCEKTDAAEGVLVILRQVQRRHPTDFWLNIELAECSGQAQPPLVDEAVRYSTVAVTLRPQSPGARLSLGFWLRKKGQQDEAIAEFREVIRLYKDFALAHNLLGLALYDKGKLDEAMAEFRHAIRLKTDFPPAHNNLGNALSDKGKVDEAIAEYRQALRLNRDYAEAHNGLGNALRATGKLDEAMAEFRHAIRINKDYAEAHNGLAAVLLEKDNVDEAIAQFQQATRLKKDYAQAHHNLGVALHGKGKLDEAIVEHRAAIRLKKDFADAHYNLGVTLGCKGNWEEAIVAYRQAILLNNDFAPAHTNLGVALHVKGKLDEAIAEFRTAIRLNKDLAEAHNNLGSVLRDKGNLDEAIVEYRTAIRLKTDFAKAHHNLGVALKGKGKLDEAIAAYRQAIRIDREFATAHNNLGAALFAKGKVDEAIAEYRTAIRLKKDYAQAHHNLGVALHGKGKLDEAIVAHRTAVRLKKNFADAHNNLGNALAANGKLDEAIAEYRTAIRLNKDLAHPHNNLGNALAAKGKLDEAIAAFRQAIRLKKDYPEAHDNLGIALHGKGKLDEAIAAFRHAIRSNTDYPNAHCNLGFALRQKGQFAESLRHLRRGHELGSRRPQWPHPSQQWARQAEVLVKLDARLQAILRGQQKPAGAAERIDLAAVCALKALPAAGTRFYQQAFREKPQLAHDLRRQYRYNAACAAVLAAAGQGKDTGALSNQERLGLRRQALTWLRADLAAWRRLLDKDPPRARSVVAQTLRHWQGDTDFTSVRGEAVLVHLPEEERQAWARLWADIAQTLAQTHGQARSAQ